MGNSRVGALLLEADLIDSFQLKRALEHQQQRGGKTVGILVELGMVEHDQIYGFLAQRGLPALNPVHCNVHQDVADLLSREFVMQHELMPVDRLGRLLTVAMVYPFDVDAIVRAEALTGLRVKPMLCRAKEFNQAARRLYPDDYERCGATQVHHTGRRISSPLVPRTNAQIAKHTLTGIQAIQGLPVAKHTKGRFSMLDAASGLNVERVGSILSRDPVAMAQVLSAANAREWTRRRPILDRHDAIRSLGMSGVLETLESSSVYQELPRQLDAVFTHWRANAVAVAETAESIAKCNGLVGGPGIYEAALLHNLGSLALLILDPADYPSVYALRPNDKRRERELEVFGVTNCEAGAKLAQAWNLPEPIVATIEHLLTPESAPSSNDTVAVTALAHHIVQMERNLETECTEALRILGLSQSDMRSTILRLHASSHANAVEI